MESTNTEMHDLEDGEIIDDTVMDFSLDTDISINIPQSTTNEGLPRSTAAPSDRDEEAAALALLMLNDHTTQESPDLMILAEKCSSSSSSRESKRDGKSSRSRFDKGSRRRRRTSSSSSVGRSHRSSANIASKKYNEYPSTMPSDRNSRNSEKVEDFARLLAVVKQKIVKSNQRLKKMEQINNNGASVQETANSIGTSNGNHLKHSACGNSGMSANGERRDGLSSKEDGNNSSRKTGKRYSSFTSKDNAKKHCSGSTNGFIDDNICVRYLEGTCTSEYCQRVHSNEKWNPRIHKKIEICKFYLQDVCIKRHKCFYMHGEYPCKYYYLGLNCEKGQSCKFAHGRPLSDELRQVLAKHVVLAPQTILGDFHRLPYDQANILITNRHIELCKLYNMENPSQMSVQSQNIPSLLAIKTTNPNEELARIESSNTPPESGNKMNDIDGTSLDNCNIDKLSGIISTRQIEELHKLGISDVSSVQFMTVAQLIEAEVNSDNQMNGNELELLASTACCQASALVTQEEYSTSSLVSSKEDYNQQLIPPIIRMPAYAYSSKDIDMRFGAVLIPYPKISFANSEAAGDVEISNMYSFSGEVYDNDLSDSDDERLVIDECYFSGSDEKNDTNHIASEVENDVNGSDSAVRNEAEDSHSVAANEIYHFDGEIKMDVNSCDIQDKKETNSSASENDTHSSDSEVKDNANHLDSEEVQNDDFVAIEEKIPSSVIDIEKYSEFDAEYIDLNRGIETDEQTSIEVHFTNSDTSIADSSDEYIEYESYDISNMSIDSETVETIPMYEFEVQLDPEDLETVEITFNSDTFYEEESISMESDISSQSEEMPYACIQIDIIENDDDDEKHARQSELITDLPYFVLNSPWYISLTPEQKNLVQQYMIFLINELNSYTFGYADALDKPDFNLNSINGNYVLRLILLRLGYFVNEIGCFYEVDPEAFPAYQVNDSSDWIMYRNEFVEQDMEFLDIVDPFSQNIRIIDENNNIELHGMFEISYDYEEESD